MSSHPLYSIKEIRAIEHAALARMPPFALMQRAGDAGTRIAMDLLEAAPSAPHILVIAGPGNNGGDALVVAANLASNGYDPAVAFFGNTASLPQDARLALEHARSSGVRIVDAETDAQALASSAWNLVIDGLFGIGLKRPIDGPLRKVVENINTLSCPVLALDVPSGLDADTGNVVGGAIAIRATDTVTFIADKPGLHTGAGRDYAGRIHVATLGLEQDPDQSSFPDSRILLTQPADFAASLRPRLHDSHKGSYGDALLVGGAQGMAGALVLASRAAAQCGAGRVLAAFLDNAPSHDVLQPEIMIRQADGVAVTKGAIILGPGLGTSSQAKDIAARLIPAEQPMVIDADALNLIATHADLQALLMQRSLPAILTPHPLEAARLLGKSTGHIQSDRITAAQELANRYASYVVLKGSGTVIAAPAAETISWINPTGNPALATGGSGDVLAGITGALLAQGWPPRDAALGAVWIHGRAADELVAQGIGPIGLVAGELIPAARAILNRLVNDATPHAHRHR
jgi:ADP-dependent NAD(P)H-hydrate dehydratase / NAD(P)H-hydrate epimerase